MVSTVTRVLGSSGKSVFRSEKLKDCFAEQGNNGVPRLSKHEKMTGCMRATRIGTGVLVSAFHRSKAAQKFEFVEA